MPYIHLRNNFVEYEFTFRQKYLFVCGDSGIGKTSLVSLVNDFQLNPLAVDCLGDTNIHVLNSITELESHQNIFFLDENNPLLYKGNSASLFAESDNYFVIITRSRRFDEYKAGLDSLVNMVVINEVHTIVPKYPRKQNLDQIADTIVCEDSGSGKLYLEALLGHTIESANSKDRFGVKLRKLKKSEYTIVYDRCGISFSYEDQLNYLQQHGIKLVSELDWDSFESYVLESDEYNVEVPWFPDKENNAVALFKEIFKDYDKSELPSNIKFVSYGKVKELILLDKQRMQLF